MKRIDFFPGLPFLLVLGTVIGSHTANGADKEKIQCYEEPEFLVIEKQLTESLGTDFLIKYKTNLTSKFPCVYIVEKGDFEIKNDWAEYFLGITDEFLVLDSSTGPGPAGLIIYDLRKRKKVYEGIYSGPMEWQKRSIKFWTETGIATQENCPDLSKWQSGGLGAAIETFVTLDLSDFSIRQSTGTRCSSRQ